MKGSHPRVGIVGGTGRMGLWLARLLEAQGIEVLRSGRKTSLRPVDMARQCEVVVVSVPIHATEEAIREIGPYVSEEGLLMDLTSLKKGPVEAMLRHSRAEVVGIHPLFGPQEKSNQSLRVALCPARGEEGLKWINGVFRRAGLEVIAMSPEAHDLKMGLIQGLNHFSTLTLALTISRSGFQLDELAGLSTPSFEQKLDRIRTVMGQSSDLFGSLLMDNRMAAGFLSQYLESAEQLMGVTRERDKAAFCHLFESIRDFFRLGPGAQGPRKRLPVNDDGLHKRDCSHERA